MKKNPVPSITPELLDGVRSFQHDIIRKALLLCAVPALLLLLMGLKPEARGLALGGLFSAADFRLAGIFTASRLKRGKRSRIYLPSAARFVLLAVPFIVAIKWQAVSLVTTFAGVFSVKAILYFDYVIRKRGGALGISSLKEKA